MPRLTEADLAAIEAREHQASPGPWYPWHRCSGVEETPDVNEVVGLGWEIVVNQDTGERAWPEPQHRGTFERGHDAYFVANARHDVPALLVEVRRLRAALHMIRTIASDDGCSDAYVSRAALVAAIEALKDTEPSHGIQSVHYSSGQMGQQRLHAAKEDPS